MQLKTDKPILEIKTESEKRIENKLVKMVKEAGGIAEKFSSPNRRGVPDRIVSWPGGKIVFVELKGTGGRCTPLQLSDHERRFNMGFDVRVVDCVEGIRNLIDDYVEFDFNPTPSQLCRAEVEKEILKKLKDKTYNQLMNYYKEL